MININTQMKGSCQQRGADVAPSRSALERVTVTYTVVVAFGVDGVVVAATVGGIPTAALQYAV
jgi:hypothetical protein